MYKTSRSKSSLFMIELMIAIFFFLLISSACIRVFAVSDKLSKSSSELQHASICLQNVTDIFYASSSYDDFIEISMNETLASEPSFSFSVYTNDWVKTDISNSFCYYQVTDYQSDNSFDYCTISIYKTDSLTSPTQSDAFKMDSLISDSTLLISQNIKKVHINNIE